MQIHRTLFVLLSVAAIGAAGTLLASASETLVPGAKIFAESCMSCHSSARRPLDNKHMTKEEWSETIDRMIDQGAEVPKAKKAELLDYLSSTHGPAVAASDAGKK